MDDQRSGRGTCVYADGSEYRGSWRSNRHNGFGTLVYPNMDEYQGKWVAGVRCGKGVWKSAQGTDVYDGIWEGDVPHGFGVRSYYDGSR